jgi:hypothetical protein
MKPTALKIAGSRRVERVKAICHNTHVVLYLEEKIRQHKPHVIFPNKMMAPIAIYGTLSILLI